MSSRLNDLLAEVARLQPSNGALSLVVVVRRSQLGMRYRVATGAGFAPVVGLVFPDSGDGPETFTTVDAAIEGYAIEVLSRTADTWEATAADKRKVATECAASADAAQAESERHGAAAKRLRGLIAAAETRGAE